MDHYIVFATLALVFSLFIWGKIRHDFVAMIGLFVLLVAGVVPSETAFSGFGHPAVITVAAILIIGKALENSGLIDVVGNALSGMGNNLLLHIAVLCVLVATASAFMNNVGALALMMPVAIHLANESGYSPSKILMPIAFSSLLGGMVTLFGTPPNIIIATFRADVVGQPFGMFDFSPVGLVVALVGLVFIILIGWRFIPHRKSRNRDNQLFEIEDYITEVLVSKESILKGKTIKEVADMINDEVHILGLVRLGQRINLPSENETLDVDDIIILETEADELQNFLSNTGTTLVGGKKFRADAEGADKIKVAEAVIMSDSPLIGRTAANLRMRSRYGVNLIAIARRERKIRKRIDHAVFQGGDVLLLQGREHFLEESIAQMGCLPLAKREIRFGYRTKIPLALGIFFTAIVLVVTGLLPVEVSFSMAAVTMILAGVLPIRKFYTSVNWPVIVLLGAMIPVGEALETSGGAALIAEKIQLLGDYLPVWGVLAVLMATTMILSDVVNNAATVVLMAPVAMGIAEGFGHSVDPYLMAVAIGASSAFLTPIGHQSNTLVMGPGGYRFTDYWRMGLPLDILIIAVAIPMILTIWPIVSP
ncbi:MAG: SLC13 family permease [Cryomorphaceae bacterium]|nr:SLC13 family permease [Cryomorphaceae bacterium]